MEFHIQTINYVYVVSIDVQFQAILRSSDHFYHVVIQNADRAFLACIKSLTLPWFHSYWILQQ